MERDVEGGSSCRSEDVNLLRVLLAKTWARVGLDSTPRRGLLCFRTSPIFSLNKWTFTKVCHVLNKAKLVLLRALNIFRGGSRKCYGYEAGIIQEKNRI